MAKIDVLARSSMMQLPVSVARFSVGNPQCAAGQKIEEITTMDGAADPTRFVLHHKENHA